MSKFNVASVLLTHQSPEMVKHMVDYWTKVSGAAPYIVYGGTYENFSQLDTSISADWVEDSRLVTKDHPRERQSYQKVFESALKLVESHSGEPISHVFFTEFDQIPLTLEFFKKLENLTLNEECDIWFSGLKRIDGTNHPHWLYHEYSGELKGAVEQESVRLDKSAAMTAYGFGQLWSLDAFRSVASLPRYDHIYLELFLPTLAYHLGYRLGAIDFDTEFNIPGLHKEIDIDTLVQKGVTLIHPIKDFWVQPRA